MKEFKNLKKEIEKIKKMGWIECDKKNTGGAGLKLENLLNLNTGNFEIPDYNNIEIKTKISSIRKTINLFNAAPDSYLFEIKRIYELYSYPSYQMNQTKVLNVSIRCNKRTYVQSDIYFSIKVNRKKKNINLIVTNMNGTIIDDITSWSFDLLQEKLERKLKFLCYIEGRKYYYNNKMYIKYCNDSYYKLKSFEQFINLIEKGIISINFRIGIFQYGKRKGQIHDHGTSFSIHEDNLSLLFDKY